MAVLYGEQNVDERYSSILEPNLYTDEVLIPGVTFTNKYEEGPAGGLFVHKLTTDAVEVGTPGRDFSDEAADDDLIQIVMNNNFQKSRKIYGVQAAAVAFNAGEEYLADAIGAVREGRQYSGLACMVYEGTDLNDTTAVTKDNVVSYLTTMRKKIKDAHGKANFVLVSTEIYALLLQVLGIASYADEATRSGELMKRFGLAIIECNSFDKSNAQFYDYTGTKRTVSLKNVDMICGYNEAFSAIDNFSMARIIDSENFAGSKAQVEINTAFRVNSPAQIVVKKNAISA